MFAELEFVGKFKCLMIFDICFYNGYIYYLFFSFFEERMWFIEFFCECNIKVIFYYVLLYDLFAGKKYGRSYGSMFNIEYFFECFIRLLIWIGLDF